jgi:PIN domain nuclease of toxin-antitoxin system
MKLLLDTHRFLWWDSNDAQLPIYLRSAIALPRNQVFVSVVTVCEIAIKRTSGKLIFGRAVGKPIEGHGFTALPFTVAHAACAGELHQLHRDPLDRLLAAQAQLEDMVLANVDEQILRYQVPHLQGNPNPLL